MEEVSLEAILLAQRDMIKTGLIKELREFYRKFPDAAPRDVMGCIVGYFGRPDPVDDKPILN